MSCSAVSERVFQSIEATPRERGLLRETGQEKILYGYSFLTYMKQSLLRYIFSGAGKFCLADGLRQLKRYVKHDVRTLNFRSDITFATLRKNTD